MVSLFLVVLAAVPVFAEDKDFVQYRPYMKDDRIIGGMPASIEEFPFIVSLVYTFNVRNISFSCFLCGGTIITKDWVLTAAHCVDLDLPSDSPPLGQFNVRAGSDYRGRGGVMRRVTHIVSHKYPPHDIGLMKDDPVPVGSPATIMGWGATDVGEGPSEILMKQEVLVISNIHCLITWLLGKLSVNTGKYICTFFDPQKTPSGAWKGDSGSPVVVNAQVVGIASRAHNATFLPNIHTPVSCYIDWIEEKVGPLPSAK